MFNVLNRVPAPSRGTVAALVLSVLFLPVSAGLSFAQSLEFDPEDRIAIIGNGLADRMQHDGWLETYLQAAHPEHELVFRNLGFTGDQVHYRPRAHEGFGDPDHHLSNVEANVIFAFFGYNESFAEDPDEFASHLREWIHHTREQQYDGHRTPRIVLFAPIAHEDLGDPNLPDGSENNARLAAYTQAMADVADEHDVVFIDLFAASQELYHQSDEPLTINGIHLSPYGNEQIARVITQGLLGEMPEVEEAKVASVREAVVDKNWHWFNRYRATSGNDVWGSRGALHGNRETLQHELTMIDVMTANRDERVWARAQGGDITISDSNVPPPQDVETTFDREVEFMTGEEAIDKMTLAEGLEANLFASEEMFPEIANPVQMQVDTRGRIWVAAWATYPKWEPLKEMNDRLVILDDTNGDGVADEATTFAYVHNPTGFEFWNGGVIVVSAPDVLFLKDTTGDNKADVRINLMGAIDSADTHHSANNIVYGPDGYIYYQRGVFLYTNVETPWRANYESDKSGMYRFNPRTHEFAFHVSNEPNPHGISFDRWGNHYITDATSGSAFHVVLNDDEFEARRLLDHTVRPVTGNQVLSSAHLPEELENNFLIYNVIGFLGAKRYELQYNDYGVWGEEIGDLLRSDDPNFRPTHGVVGNDGALYVSDWHNPVIGHMQHNLRDPMRDHEHGRIYRISAPDRPLQEPVSIHGESIEHLLDLLQHPVDGVRHRVRIELSGRDTEEVASTAQQWVQQFDPQDPSDVHPMLEILWLHQQHNVENHDLLNQLLASPDERARTAAERVAWFWMERDTPVLARRDVEDDLLTEDDRTAAVLDLSDEETAVLTIEAVMEEMRFDVEEFTVRAGQHVFLTLENPDYMPHNLLIVEPGAADEIAQEAIDLGAEGFAMEFIPDNPKVLQATSMLERGERETLDFFAPAEPGEYQFVCTFPGHGTLMRGIMRVVE